MNIASILDALGLNHQAAAVNVPVRKLLLCSLIGWPWLVSVQAEPVQFPRSFAALEGYVKPLEQPYREQVCLNGSWQFQPLAIPRGYQRNLGQPPELPPPGAAWEETPIRIPSPWNANSYGCGREVGAGTKHPYWPDSVWFPSYPAAWDGVQMGWLRRSFAIPSDWRDKRIWLHFEAVAGGCQVLVNGRPAGEHFDNFMPFDLDITALVHRDGNNELLVGVRHPHLYDQTNSVYAHERATYADGSNLDHIAGIWQDVYLLGLPVVRVADAFVQPWVDRGELLVETTLCNDTDRPRKVTVAGSVSPWVNDAGTNVLDAPEPKWHLAGQVLAVPSQTLEIPPGSNMVVRLKAAVHGELKPWSPDFPNLYGLVLKVMDHQNQTDSRYVRFGWRQFQIHGADLQLNGHKFQVFADILHPFGMVVHSRRNAWAWFKVIKEVGGNGVRLHAQPWPSYYQDLADEMGLVVLAEDGLFGSSLGLNFTEDISWHRFAEHYDAMVRRDRNHPSVFGWSFGNELFAIFDYNHMTREDRDKYYAKLTELGRRSYALDPTREWISCDGDEDLRGTLPVWSKHFGHGLSLDRLPAGLNKPLMVGESGGTYYARPSQLAVFNGDRAYENYAGRNEALGIDVYQNIVQMARPRLAYFSASELVWFGLEHLPLGYHDFTRLPNLQDGVFFPAFEEGRPGVQPERIPPFCTTLNPALDPGLPVYRPLAMFDAMKAALAPGSPKPSPWDHLQPSAPASPVKAPTISSIGYIGNRAGTLFATLTNLAAPMADEADVAKAGLLVVDGESLSLAEAEAAKSKVDAFLTGRGRILMCFHRPNAPVEPANRLLPAPIRLTSREATALDRGEDQAWNPTFSLADLYFGENEQDRRILKCGLDGEFVNQGTVLLKASNTDWSQFNNMPEVAKCAAVVLYEKLAKPAGAALVRMKIGEGEIFVSTIEYAPTDHAYGELWRHVLGNLGVKIGRVDCKTEQTEKPEHDLLLNGPKN